MQRKKKLTLLSLVIVILVAFMFFLIQPSTSTPYKECVLNTCDCQCYTKGQIIQHSIGTTSCQKDCKQLFNIIGCDYVGLKCPYDITACAFVDAINDVFISKKCEIIKEE